MGAAAAPAPAGHGWNADALWRALDPALPGLSVEVVARLGSTNTVLVDRCRQAVGRRAADTQPCLLVAEHQMQGRGRQGRTWHSEPGASLTFSLMLPLAPADWSGLSLAVGVALADALDPPSAARPRIGLKWPNDLWLWEGEARGRKLGGILVETVAVGVQRMAVVGVGLNVMAPSRQEVADGWDQGMAHLGELAIDGRDAPAAPTAPGVLWQVAVPLAHALRRFELDGLAPFLARYARRDVLAGQPVRTLGTAPSLTGVAEGIAGDGALCVRTAEGLERVVGGEVSVRLDGDAAA